VARRRLLALLRDRSPAGAILLSGDVHYAEKLGTAAAPGGILEMTSSGLNRSCGSKGGLPRAMCEALLRVWHAHREPHDGVSGPVGAATPLGGATVELNFGTIAVEWPTEHAGGNLLVQAHGVDGAPLLRHVLPLGLGAQLEARRWQAALGMPTIFDEARWLRAPVFGGLAACALVLGLGCRACGSRRRAPPAGQRAKLS